MNLLFSVFLSNGLQRYGLFFILQIFFKFFSKKCKFVLRKHKIPSKTDYLSKKNNGFTLENIPDFR